MFRAFELAQRVNMVARFNKGSKASLISFYFKNFPVEEYAWIHVLARKRFDDNFNSWKCRSLKRFHVSRNSHYTKT